MAKVEDLKDKEVLQKVNETKGRYKPFFAKLLRWKKAKIVDASTTPSVVEAARAQGKGKGKGKVVSAAEDAYIAKKL